MTPRHLWAAAFLIGIIILIGFILSVPHTSRDVGKAVEQVTEAPHIPTVALKDSYKKGTHTLSGSLTAPNACATASVSATSTQGAILLSLTLVTDDKTVCLQTPTDIKFSTSLNASASLPITVTVNGVIASTTAL